MLIVGPLLHHRACGAVLLVFRVGGVDHRVPGVESDSARETFHRIFFDRIRVSVLWLEEAFSGEFGWVESSELCPVSK